MYDSEGLGTFFFSLVGAGIVLFIIVIFAFASIFKWHNDSKKKD